MSHIGSDSLKFPSLSGSSNITVSPTAPVSPLLNDLWLNNGTSTVSGVGSGVLSHWNGISWVPLAGKCYHLKVSANIAQIINGTTTIATKSFNIINHDSANGWSVANNEYTIQKDGIYTVSINIASLCTSNGVGNSGLNSFVYINGSPFARFKSGTVYSPSASSGLGVTTVGCASFRLLSGDVVRAVMQNGTIMSQTQNTTIATDNYMTITKIGDL